MGMYAKVKHWVHRTDLSGAERLERYNAARKEAEGLLRQAERKVSQQRIDYTCKSWERHMERDANYYTPDGAKRKWPLPPEIKDSGTRSEFETGAVRDGQTGKGRMDLMPVRALLAVSKIMEDGAIKYDARNWEKGIPLSRYMDSGIRHALKYLKGDRDERHLAMACWNFLCLLDTQERITEGLLPMSLNDLPYNPIELKDPGAAPRVELPTSPCGDCGHYGNPCELERDPKECAKDDAAEAEKRIGEKIPGMPGMYCFADQGHDCIGIRCVKCNYCRPLSGVQKNAEPFHRLEIRNLRSWPGRDPCNCWEHCAKLSKNEPCSGCEHLFNNKENQS